jgi:hypothetical protein
MNGKWAMVVGAGEHVSMHAQTFPGGTVENDRGRLASNLDEIQTGRLKNIRCSLDST